MKFQCRSKSKADWDTPTLIHLHFACGCIRTKTDLSSCKQTVWSIKPEKCTMWLFTEKKSVPIPGLEHLDLGFSETSQARCCQGEAWSSQTWAMPALGTLINKYQNLARNLLSPECGYEL